MPNPKIQVIVSDQLKAQLEEEAERQSKTLSAYCAELLGLLHTYPWIIIRAPKVIAKKLKSLLS